MCTKVILAGKSSMKQSSNDIKNHSKRVIVICRREPGRWITIARSEYFLMSCEASSNNQTTNNAKISVNLKFLLANLKTIRGVLLAKVLSEMVLKQTFSASTFFLILIPLYRLCQTRQTCCKPFCCCLIFACFYKRCQCRGSGHHTFVMCYVISVQYFKLKIKN